MKQLFKRLFGMSVSVNWEGDTYVHYCMSQSEARHWMRQYPIDAGVVVQDWIGCLLFARRSAV